MNVKQMLSFMKMKGFMQSKDVLGTYFDRDNRKFTINKQAQWFTCYHNVKSGMSWELVSKSQVFNDFSSALNWVVREVENNRL